MRPVSRSAEAATHRQQLSVVDLFSGAGGISEGFRQAGFEVLGGNDLDPDAIATFSQNFPSAAAIVGDLRKALVREKVIDIAKRADVIVGGPPCQAFSQMRNHSRLIDDPRNSLYREFVRVVAETSPKAFVMENVTGLDQMGVRQQVAKDLSLHGEYEVVPQILNAADFGVPQTRERLLFVGLHRSLRVPAPMLVGSGAMSSIALARFQKSGRTRYQVVVQDSRAAAQLGASLADSLSTKIVTAAQAISDLTDLPMGNRQDRLRYAEHFVAATAFQREMRRGAGAEIANVQVPRINNDTALRLVRIPQGGNYRDLPSELLERYITGERWGQDNGSGKLSRRHFYAYRRLHPDIWAWTLNTKADAVYHYGVPRALSVREFARLQSFPDRFVVTTDSRSGMIPGRIDGGPAHSRYRQVGNAVPPLLARAAAQAIRQAIEVNMSRRKSA